MPHARLSWAAAILCALSLLAATVAEGALVRVNGIVLHADGRFQPQTLLRHRFTPIDFQGFFEIKIQGEKSVVLEQVAIDFDRDGRLDVAGLPTCPPERIANASTVEARRVCAGAIVGNGRVEGEIALAGGRVAGSTPLTIFNGPRLEGRPTAILHARVPVANHETLVIVAPIERRGGEFRYRVTLDLPPIAGGQGTITGVEAEVGRRFVGDGKRRSYVSARCSDNILQTRGRFLFSDGTVIWGSVEKYCRAE
jgi:hypothetical protein